MRLNGLLARSKTQNPYHVSRPFGLLDVWSFGFFAVPTITDQALCIRCWDFSETSQTVSLFTRGYGVVRGLAKGAKRQKGAFSGGLDVLTRGEVVAIIKPGRDLATITAWHLIETHRVLRESLAANQAAMYMVDLIHHMIPEHDPHPKLFDAMLEALDSLNQPQNAELTLLNMQWNLLGETGYLPQVQRDARSGSALPDEGPTLMFSAAAGGLVTDGDDADRWGVRRQTVVVLQKLATGARIGSGDDPESLRRANRLLAAYFREIIGSEPSSMRWAFSDLATPADPG